MLRDSSDNPFVGSKYSAGKSTQKLEKSAQNSEETLDLPLSINQVTTYRSSFEEDISGFKDAEIKSIGLWLSKIALFGQKNSIDLIQDSGLNVSSLGWVGGFTGANGHSFEESLKEAYSAIDLAKNLNAQSVIVISGAQSGHLYKHATRLLMEALQWLGDYAGEKDIKLALQPMHPIYAEDWTFLTSLDPTMEVLEACNHEAVGLCFNAYHLWQEKNLLEKLQAIAPLIYNVKLSDWHALPQSQQDHSLIGEGKIPLADIVQILHENDYQYPYEVEIWSEEIWKQSPSDLLIDCKKRFQKIWNQATPK